jgi:hypothetical protein
MPVEAETTDGLETPGAQNVSRTPPQGRDHYGPSCRSIRVNFFSVQKMNAAKK